jgi:hypothetical protein
MRWRVKRRTWLLAQTTQNVFLEEGVSRVVVASSADPSGVETMRDEDWTVLSGSGAL